MNTHECFHFFLPSLTRHQLECMLRTVSVPLLTVRSVWRDQYNWIVNIAATNKNGTKKI